MNTDVWVPNATEIGLITFSNKYSGQIYYVVYKLRVLYQFKMNKGIETARIYEDAKYQPSISSFLQYS